MYCQNCGKENNDFVNFCSYCGGKLGENKPINPEPAYKTLEKQIEKMKEEPKKLEIDLNVEIPKFGVGEYYRGADGERKYKRPKLLHFIDLYDKKTKMVGDWIIVPIILMMVSFFASFIFLEGNKNKIIGRILSRL